MLQYAAFTFQTPRPLSKQVCSTSKLRLLRATISVSWMPFMDFLGNGTNGGVGVSDLARVCWKCGDPLGLAKKYITQVDSNCCCYNHQKTHRLVACNTKGLPSYQIDKFILCRTWFKTVTHYISGTQWTNKSSKIHSKSKNESSLTIPFTVYASVPFLVPTIVK